MTGQLRIVRLCGVPTSFSILLSVTAAGGLFGFKGRAEIFYLGTQAGHHVAEISAGGAVSVFADLPAGAAYPAGVAFDASGNLFASDPNKNTITKITPTGTASLFKTLPSLSGPTGIAF